MIVDSALYRRGVRVRVDLPTDDVAGLHAMSGDKGDFVWVGLHEPSLRELEEVAGIFGLHALAVEDAWKAHQRPKLEHFEESLFLTLKTVWYVDEEDAVETGEINLFLGKDFVITVRHGSGSPLHERRAFLEAREQVLEHGPSSVLYAVCDLVVDGYQEVVAELEVDVDEVEESVFSEQRTSDSVRIYTLKRELIEMRRAVLPLREPMRQFVAGAVPGIDEGSAPFFRDVADHLARVAEAIDSLDGLLSAAFDAHLASISVQQNEDMRKISAGAALVVVPTLIAGIYGMNFDHMPELHWAVGYPFALLLMVGTSGALLWLFKRSGWL